ncbi:MAG: LptF/LptG family permease [Planctomycetes bacterium]|nr:LptF/LptG family permease [Planctomycetota bacterium]MCP4838597.1 LptF/LptG family permease [Planctomycetota bacterium]
MNFVLLFAVLFLFASTIDVILNLDEFTKLAKKASGEDASWITQFGMTLGYAANYHLPQFFQFYAWLYGIVLVGAAGFTLVQMNRCREFVAIVACGVSLRRLAMPFLCIAVGLSAIQILNQELVLPRVAPLLLRSHRHASQDSVDAYPVRFTDDAAGTLLQAASFDPGTGRLRDPSFIARDSQGRTTGRWWAKSADWNAAEFAWDLTDGQQVEIEPDGRGSSRAKPADQVKTDLSPTRLAMRRYGQVASMLSLGQISDMLEWPDSREAPALRRSAMTRFSVLVLNILVLIIAIPFFLDRVPGGLFVKSIKCAGLVIPLYFTAAGIMLIPIPGIGSLLESVLPVLVLLPVALLRVGGIKT